MHILPGRAVLIFTSEHKQGLIQGMGWLATHRELYSFIICSQTACPDSTLGGKNFQMFPEGIPPTL